MKTLKGVLINSETKEIKEVLIEQDENGSNLASIYAILNCTTIEAAERSMFDPLHHTLYVDEEGLLKDNPKGAFQIGGVGQVLSGNGLILGLDIEGNSISHNLRLNVLEALIHWRDTTDLPEPDCVFIPM